MARQSERYVVCLDEQRMADEATLAAVHHASLTGAEIELVHGVPVPRSTSVGLGHGRIAELHHMAAEHARDQLLARLAELEDRAGLTATFLRERLLVRAGHPAQVIVDRARERGARLCFLGSHVQRPLVDFGGTLRGVFAHAPCGVWYQPVAFREVRRILAPIDLSVGSRVVLEYAIELGRQLGASVQVLHSQGSSVPIMPIPEPQLTVWPESVREDLAAATRHDFDAELASIEWGGVEHESRCLEGDPVASILEFARDADLVVMGTHGHTGLSGALLGNVTWSVVHRTPVPLLALPLTGREFVLRNR